MKPVEIVNRTPHFFVVRMPLKILLFFHYQIVDKNLSKYSIHQTVLSKGCRG